MKMLNLIQSLEKFGMNSEGCKRMEALCQEIGNPEKKLKFIHVGGTNGKGSTCHMLASILQQEGYKVGVYISPALFKFNERISINGNQITDKELDDFYPIFKKALESFNNHPLGYPTEFEVVTALAFLYYAEQQVDYVVLEVGLGGRFDATNVVTPLLSIITNIDLDHTQILGDTIEEIAFEKAGIIKEDVPICLGFMDSNAKRVIIDVAKEKKSKVYFAENVDIQLIENSIEGQKLKYQGKELVLSMLGKQQLENVKISLKAVEILKEKNIIINFDSIESGLKKVKWPGRFEVIELKNKKIVLDVAHNPNSMEVLVDNLLNYFGEQEIVMVIGIFKDKDISSMLQLLKGKNIKLYLTQPVGERGLNIEQLEKFSIDAKLKIIGKNSDPVQAFVEACERKGPIITVCGSFNTVGPVRHHLFSKNT